jgi:hypothetical protein
LFADFFRPNRRTFENWEEGRARANAQAALLIALVNKFPDMVDRVAHSDASVEGEGGMTVLAAGRLLLRTRFRPRGRAG